jgi:hypothetical protein
MEQNYRITFEMLVIDKWRTSALCQTRGPLAFFITAHLRTRTWARLIHSTFTSCSFKLCTIFITLFTSRCSRVASFLHIYYWKIWRSWIRASWYNYENNQQNALYRLIYYSKSALHVSDNVFAHHQEHLTVFTVSVSVHRCCCRLVSQGDTSRQQRGWTLPDTVNTVKCSWWWAKSLSETCRADLE